MVFKVHLYVSTKITGKICLTKNVFNSTICQRRINWKIATNRIQEHPGSSQREWFHVSGVNWSKALLSRPDLELIFLNDSQ
jgi:hypothetical protein